MIDDAGKAKLRRFMELRDERDHAKKALEQAEEDYREAEVEMYAELEKLKDPNDPNAKPGAIRAHLGEPWGTVTFRQRETIFGRIFDEDAAQEYFEQRAMLDEVSQPKFVQKRISEIVRDCREQGVDMPPGIDYYPRRGITVTRQKG